MSRFCKKLLTDLLAYWPTGREGRDPKIYSLYIKSHNMAKNVFLVEVTQNVRCPISEY